MVDVIMLTCRIQKKNECPAFPGAVDSEIFTFYSLFCYHENHNTKVLILTEKGRSCIVEQNVKIGWVRLGKDCQPVHSIHRRLISTTIDRKRCRFRYFSITSV